MKAMEYQDQPSLPGQCLQYSHYSLFYYFNWQQLSIPQDKE
jgi:hypothetical protein